VNRDQQRLIDELSSELEDGNLAMFIGAGFSRAAGYVDWKSLLKPIAEELELDVDKEWDLVTLAQYHANVNQANRAKLNQLLVTEFSTRLSPTEGHRILTRLPIQTYWTTNYDRLIETTLESYGKVADVKYTPKQLATTKQRRDAVVYKMHGDAEHASEAVLIRDDYERYHLKMEQFITALSGDLISKTFLFLGFSFTDPNLEYILSRVRIQYGPDQRQHHCILRRATKGDNENQADFEYRERKEKLFAGELLRVGIKVTYVESHSDITKILKALEDKHKKRTVFISGAADDYSPWSQQEVQGFVHELAKEVSQDKFRIISGFGLGIGGAVISGVVEDVIKNGGRLDNDKLIVRPFPQTQTGERSLRDLWREYRHAMLDHAGVAIFLFGNKIVDGKVVESNGMREEFEIAKQKGIFIIPVGITGNISRKLWEEVVRDFKVESHPKGADILKLLQALGDEKSDFNDAKGITTHLLRIL